MNADISPGVETLTDGYESSSTLIRRYNVGSVQDYGLPKKTSMSPNGFDSVSWDHCKSRLIEVTE